MIRCVTGWQLWDNQCDPGIHHLVLRPKSCKVIQNSIQSASDLRVLMYIPAAFRESDLGRLHECMDQHSFAILTSNGPNGLIATHLPLILDRTQGPFGTLRGHFAKANEQAMEIGSAVLAVFSGPHAYISPTWYQSPDTVPTWNYVAVHAYGTMRPVEDFAALGQMLQALVQKYESTRANPWPFDPDTSFHQSMMKGIIGFEIEITQLEGKWKLNQNHPEERRRRVVAALNEAGGHDQNEVARMMEQTLASE